MIYTLTTNPSLDMNICSNPLQPNTVTRTWGAVYSPRGKGLNVSFALQRFGVPSTVLGFFGGFSGEFIVNGCRDGGLAVQPIWVEDTTRINVFLNDSKDEYNLVNAGSFVPRERQEALLSLLRTLEAPEMLCISGSLPRGIQPSFYEEILEICAERDISVVLDISSPKLKDLLSFRPLLIKPNDVELLEVFGLETDTEEQVLEAMAELHRLGAQNVLLTLGDRGAYFSDGSACYNADVYPVKVLSTVCCGDSCLSGFLSVWLADRSAAAEALRRGAACGANTAESAGLGALDRVEEYAEKITVRKL